MKSHHIDRLDFKADLLALQQRFPDTFPYLLASTAHSLDDLKRNSRYDILMAHPGERLWLDHRFELHADFSIEGHDFLNNLDEWFRRERDDLTETSLPFRGGWFIYMAYEMAQQIEPVLEMPPADSTAPIAIATRVPAAVIIDHVQGCTFIVAEPQHAGLIADIRERITSLPISESGPAHIEVSAIDESAIEPYFEQVARIKRYIFDGDIFQANLSRRWSIRLAQRYDDAALFASLAESNPASFACLLKLGESSIISSSPERLVRVEQGVVETRPIAGTRPRSASAQEDAELSSVLLSHPKERAEHIMLIDLERNDLGRVCEPGTVEVDELLTLESWRHVHHIVSNVKGRLRREIGPGDVLRAVFPGGTITGCPKVRCMQILAEQEREARGAYTGTAGYVNTDGSMDTNILIRTLTRLGEDISLRAGGGIVADSDPQHELLETRAKAKGMLQVFALDEQIEDQTA